MYYLQHTTEIEGQELKSAELWLDYRDTENKDEEHPFKVHPQYLHSDADLVISSSDNIRFQVHSSIMKRGSEVFNRMLWIPRDTSESSDDPIPMSERSNIIVDLLNIIYPDGDQFQSLSSPHYAMELYTAAEKYEMKKAMRVVRHMSMTAESGPQKRPLESYVMACNLGWEQEAKLASQWSLDITLDAPASLNVLSKLRRVDHLVRLQSLHRKRKDLILYDFSEPHTLRDIMSSDFSPQCGRPDHIRQLNRNDVVSKCLKSIIFMALDACPSGSVLGTEDFWCRPDVEALWSFRCHACGNSLVDQTRMAVYSQGKLSLLPSSI